jgi:SPP1 family predicted phage head-tail adaptor
MVNYNRIGNRNKYLTFQAPSKSTDGAVTWTTIFSCYGSVKPLSGRESITAQQVQSPITGKVCISYRPVNILTTWRIKLKGKYLNIAALPINVDGKNMELEIKITGDIS